MTVGELIAHLQQFDPELDVVAYASIEDYDILTPDGITLENGEYYKGESAFSRRMGLHVEIIGGVY